MTILGKNVQKVENAAPNSTWLPRRPYKEAMPDAPELILD